MGKILYEDGKEEDIIDVSLDNLQNIVQGYIEIIKLNRMKEQPYSFMIVNEEGLIRNFPKNEKATSLCCSSSLNQYNIGEGIFGNVVLLKKEEIE